MDGVDRGKIQKQRTARLLLYYLYNQSPDPLSTPCCSARLQSVFGKPVGKYTRVAIHC